jgi:hypothetical protein
MEKSGLVCGGKWPILLDCLQLFVREKRSDENAKTEDYTCLGLADYTSHQGSAPISIMYKLRERMPARLMRASNRFVEIG